ncbi:hypothetical protein OU995_11955 [Roseateles sp. SL47]|uniref:hypothetical protein n=1 Tax=Roseateles sp. SL47 TaxID=2995138 RepID=UPI00226E52AB|nr:hypothetical protein [Roseateles sp. SL47]WAC75363.1 hypothetical protein OU995_11955 [Roseateles sp. SL47]
MATKAKVKNRLPQFTETTKHRAARVINQALVLGASEASVLTPIDTSLLLNSQFRAVGEEGDKVVGRVGYTAEYAMAVHDPANHQNFRRATAEKEFLKKGFERAAPNIDAVMKKVMKV